MTEHLIASYFRRGVNVTVLLALGLSPATALSNSQCTIEDLKDGRLEFPDWKALYVSYSRFKNCDNGGYISEGYSESVVRLLADHWNSLPEFAAISGKHPGFQQFVMRHIDATTNVDDLTKISESATKHCPPGHATLCVTIVEQATAAIKESGI